MQPEVQKMIIIYYSSGRLEEEWVGALPQFIAKSAFFTASKDRAKPWILENYLSIQVGTL